MFTRTEYLQTKAYAVKQKEVKDLLVYAEDENAATGHFANNFRLFASFLYKLQKTLDIKLIITGGPGTGKTMLCKLIEKQMRNNREEIVVYYEDDMQLSFRSLKEEAASFFVDKEKYEGYTIIDGLLDVQEHHLQNEKCITAVMTLNQLGLQRIAKLDQYIHVKLDRVSLYVPETIEVKVINNVKSTNKL